MCHYRVEDITFENRERSVSASAFPVDQANYKVTFRNQASFDMQLLFCP